MQTPAEHQGREQVFIKHTLLRTYLTRLFMIYQQAGGGKMMSVKDKIVLDESHMVIGGSASPPRVGKERTVSSYTDDGEFVQTIFFDSSRFNSPKQARKALIEKYGNNGFVDLKIN